MDVSVSTGIVQVQRETFKAYGSEANYNCLLIVVAIGVPCESFE